MKSREELRQEKQRLNGKLNWIDSVINEYIGGRFDDMGLIDDDVRTPTFAALKRERAIIFENLRQFNAKHAKELRLQSTKQEHKHDSFCLNYGKCSE